MAELYLDGARVDFEDTGSSTLGELISAIENELKGLGRYVAGISLDGEGVDGWRVNGSTGRLTASFNVISLVSASLDDLAHEGKRTVREYIKFIEENIDNCVKDLRLKGAVKAEEFASVTDGIVETVKTAEAIAGSAGLFKINVFSAGMIDHYKGILNNLQALRDAKDSGDPILLADTLEYELRPAIEAMEEKLFFENN